MSMFCYQCQETIKNQGCTKNGVCGKGDVTSNLHDLLVYTLQGISLGLEATEDEGNEKYGRFLSEALFVTITNANFDDGKIINYIRKALKMRRNIKNRNDLKIEHDSFNWQGEAVEDFREKASEVGILSYSDNEDKRSLKSLILYGLKGIAAYAEHAAVLGYNNEDIYKFMVRGLVAITKDKSVEELIGLALETGEVAVKAMELLDEANTKTYGHPEISEVNLGVKDNPGILITGHDLKDMEELLKQTEGTGVDIYTHGEMLPANYYPEFKKYNHLVGNYGNSWWKQNKEFDSFNGPIVVTTNCLTPVKDSYKDRIFTTGTTGFPGVKHILERKEGGKKDFSEVIKLAKKCDSPEEIEQGKITGGFARNQVLALADKVVEAVKSGAIKRFVVMAGCDGRFSSRDYFTEVAEELPRDTVILTAGCAKYRYNKLDLGAIGGIPRVLDAGQCNDSYSLAVIALKLKEVFELEDVNDLPISFDLAWYEQKAVAVFLALLSLGFKNIRLGPTLPDFLSENVAGVLVDKFNIMKTGEPAEDIKAMMNAG